MEWIEKSEFYLELKEMYQDENVTVDKRFFDFPDNINMVNIRKILDNIRFFGIYDEEIQYKCFKFVITLSTDLRMELKNEFPELKDIFNIHIDTCEKAIENNSMFSLRFCKENNIRWCKITSMYAVKNNDSKFIKYLYENGCDFIMDITTYCKLNPLKYLHSINFLLDEKTCAFAAFNGNLNCLKFAHENGAPWNSETCEYAAKNGHLDCLKYAHEHGCKWDSNTCKHSAFYGHLKCLQYTLEHGCPCDWFVSFHATLAGNLECLKCVHEYGCPLDERTSSIAIKNGNLLCLKFLHENGCAIDTYTFNYNIDDDYLKCIDYLIEIGIEIKTKNIFDTLFIANRKL